MMVLINGLPDDRITISDRGLQYGDGLFETMAYREGIIEFLDAHLARLTDGCRRFKIEFEQVTLLRNELNLICQDLASDSAIIKVIITRGSGGRGYLATSGIEPTRIISAHPFPIYPPHYSQSGVNVRLCTHVLSDNTALAGIKHLNRLDQVLARNEWHDPDIAEGLMLNHLGNVIEGTMSNVFIVKADHLLTPVLDKSGVAGIMRMQLMLLAVELNIAIEECTVSCDDLLSADEVFISNSVIGIWPVSNIEGVAYKVGPTTQRLQHALQQMKK